MVQATSSILDDELAGQLSGKHFLLAGGAGFLGSNMAMAMMRAGAHVTVLDNMLTGRRSNLSSMMNKSGFDIVEHDIVEPLPQRVLDSEWDGIFNLACAASPPHYQARPVHTFRTSVWGNWNLAQLALSQKVRLLYTSTSEVYGDPQVHPQPETYWGNVNPIGIRSCYDEGKRGGETLLHDLAAGEGLQVRIARIFNTYGPMMDYADGRVVSNFLVQAIRKEPLSIYGNGSQSRSFCFVDDMVRGLLLLFFSDAQYNAQPVNLGNDREFTIVELVRAIENLLGEPLHVEHHPLPGDDPKVRKPDLTRARQWLGWEPRIPLEEGLKPTLAYFRDEIASITGF